MKLKAVSAALLLALASACVNTTDDGTESEASVDAAVSDEEAKGGVASTSTPLELLGRIDNGAYSVLFYKHEGGSLSLLQTSPLGERELVPAELVDLDFISLWRQLAPNEAIPAALTDATLAALGDEAQDYAPADEIELERAQGSAPLPADGASPYTAAEFQAFCNANSPNWCATNRTGSRRRALEDVHKTGVMLDILSGTAALAFLIGSQQSHTDNFGPSHVTWGWHNNHGFLGYALEADIAWEVWSNTASLFHWGGWYCDNDCFTSATGF